MTATSQPPHNLPPPASPFVGREDELMRIAQYLDNPACRLLTLVGPGGAGKTRLAVEAASRRLPHLADGAFLIRLEALEEPAFIVPTIADALGVPLQGQQEPRGHLLNYLRSRHTLLVLDNFEHVVAGATLLPEILASAPGVQILTTSREQLKLEEEWVLPVEGFPLPTGRTVESLEAESAGRLFLQRARRVHGAFDPSRADVANICRICGMVGGLPLGIELAATWIKMLSCAEIAQEIERSLDFLNSSLRNVPARHRSLRAVFEYSWQLLTDDERRVFRQLAVFRGGFRREAAAAVAGARLPVLAALADKSLLEVTPGGRYERHLTLWQFADEKLAEAGEEHAAVQARHATYYAAFLEERTESLRGAQPQEALAEIDAEIENIRLAWQWALDQRSMVEIAQSVESLEAFYDTRGWYREGADAFARAVTALGGAEAAATGEHSRLLGSVLARQGSFCQRRGELEAAEAWLQQSLLLLRPLPAPRDLAYTLQRLGQVVAQRGEYTRARAYHEESLECARGSDDRRGVMHALNALGLDAEKLGEFVEARHRYEASLALARDLADLRMVARISNYLGYMLCTAGDPDAALPFLRKSLDLVQELDDAGLLPYVLGSLGQAAFARGELDAARRFTESSLEQAQAQGDRMLMTYALLRLGRIAVAKHDGPQAEAYFHQGLQTAMEIAAVPRALAALVGLADVRALAGDAGGALELLEQPLRHPATDHAARLRAEALQEQLLQALSPAAAAAAQARGRDRSLVEVVEALLGIRLPTSLAGLLAIPEFVVEIDLTRQAQQVEEITGLEVFTTLGASADQWRREVAGD